MIKKIAFILLVIAAVSCGIWGYLYLTDLKRPTKNPLSILPDNCTLLLEVKNIHLLSEKLNQGNLMWEELLKANAMKQFNRTLQKADSLLGKSRSGFVIQTLYMAFYKNAHTQSLAAFNLADINTNEPFISFLQDNFQAKKTSAGLYECKNADYTFFVSVNQGLVICADNAAFLQETLKGTKKTLSKNISFTEAYQAEGKENDINIFIHLPFFYTDNWNDFFASSLKDHTAYGSKKESWVSADILVSPNEVNTQGFLSNDSSAFYLALKNQDVLDFKTTFHLLPYNTLQLQALSISKYTQFITNCYAGNLQKRQQDLQAYTDKINANAQTEIEKFIGDQVVLFSANYGSLPYEYGLIPISEEKTAAAFLKTICDSSFVTEDSISVYFDSKEELFSQVCGRFFTKKFKYIATVPNALIFSDAVSSISEYKRAVSEKNNFLANDRAINFMDKNLSTESAYLFYTDVFKCQEEIVSKLSKNMLQIFDHTDELLDNYESAALTLERLKDKLFFKACTDFNPKTKLYQNTLWETLLDTDLYSNPTPVKNHLTGETELACTDVKNNLYLLSNTGKILWRKNIGEKILGSIYQVDYFNNGKLQLVFNTANRLHIIDRNGNNVSGFPLKLNMEAIGGLTLFDYEKNKNYRLWIPLKNNTTGCYAINGRQLIDFSPVHNTGHVTRMVLQQKDYFILMDTSGNINVVNRKGENRVKINTKLIGALPESLFIEEGKNEESTYLCYINTSAKKLIKISLTDKVQEIAIPEPESINAAFFDTLQHTTSPLIICITEKGMNEFDFFGKKLHALALDKNFQLIKPLLVKNNHEYAALETVSGKLFLLNTAENKITDTEIKLSALPDNCRLITNEKPYLVGFYANKVFCIKQ